MSLSLSENSHREKISGFLKELSRKSLTLSRESFSLPRKLLTSFTWLLCKSPLDALKVAWLGVESARITEERMRENAVAKRSERGTCTKEEYSSTVSMLSKKECVCVGVCGELGTFNVDCEVVGKKRRE
jgi:hypothetical protein